MEIRRAEAADHGIVEALARDSFRSSYALSPQQIDTVVEHEFGPDAFAARVEDPEEVVFVAEDDDDVRGVLTLRTDEERTIRWLHVDPDARGEGVATELIERAVESGNGTPLSARVLEDAVEGGEFMERFGLERTGTDRTTIGEEEFSVTVFSEGHGTEDANEPTVAVPASVTVDGGDRPVDRERRIPGRNAPFFVVYSSAAREDRYGFLCSHCGSTDVAADGLDRVECGECSNIHLADEWDGSYL